MLLRNRLSRSRISIVLGLGVCTLPLLLLTACSSGPGQARDSAVIHVTERDFHISVKPARVSAGDVRLVLHNHGPDTHELIIVRSTDGRLPLRSDGLTVDEDALHRVTVGSTEGERPGGGAHDLHLHLRPGRYELFCNMAGHYLGGMRAELVVS